MTEQNWASTAEQINKSLSKKLRRAVLGDAILANLLAKECDGF